MTAYPLDNLNQRVAIVDRMGSPTLEFMIKWQQLKTGLANITGITTAAEMSAILDLIGATKGDILYRGASEWETLTIGTTDEVLTVAAGGTPTWAAVPGGDLSTEFDAQFGSTKDDLLIRGASSWEALAPPTAIPLQQWVLAGTGEWLPISNVMSYGLGYDLGSLAYASGGETNPWVVLDPGTTGKVLVTGGSTSPPTWEGINSILDAAYGTEWGSILFRGSSGWEALAPGAAGQFLTTHGVNADPTWTTGGGGGGGSGLFNQVLSSTPTQSGTGLTTWLHQNLASVSDGATGMCLQSPNASALAISGLYGPAPSTPYTITALIAVAKNTNEYDGVALGWYDGSNKTHAISLSTQGGNGNDVQVDYWNNPTNYAGTNWTTNSLGSNVFSQPIWFQIEDDGTTVYFRYGYDGVNFITGYSVAKSSGWLGSGGYSNVLFYTNPQGGTNIATLLSWTVTT